MSWHADDLIEVAMIAGTFIALILIFRFFVVEFKSMIDNYAKEMEQDFDPTGTNKYLESGLKEHEHKEISKSGEKGFLN